MTTLARVARFPRLRALTWVQDTLYASRGYELLRAKIPADGIPSDSLRWEKVASFDRAGWRTFTARTKLTSRLLRDGFHALAVLPSGAMVGAVPGAILKLHPKTNHFEVSHKVLRGTRPLHITQIPNGTLLWGEYFDNPSREEVHIYTSADEGSTWNVAYTFAKGEIRHVHNIVHDPWQNCLWILTGDDGDECRIIRASYDFREMGTVLKGNQQARSVACVPTQSGLYFATDTPTETNAIYHLDSKGLRCLAPLTSSSICGCRVAADIFFSTMVEPSSENPDQYVRLFGAREGQDWQSLLAWKKDRWSMRFFQYGNAFLPGGHNRTPYLALTTIAVESDDMTTSLYSVQP